MSDNTKLSPRAGWAVSDGDPTPGDQISLTATVEEMPDDVTRVCRYCSSPDHEGAIMERGHVQADYQLVDAYGNVLGYSCHACISEAEIIERGE